MGCQEGLKVNFLIAVFDEPQRCEKVECQSSKDVDPVTKIHAYQCCQGQDEQDNGRNRVGRADVGALNVASGYMLRNLNIMIAVNA